MSSAQQYGTEGQDIAASRNYARKKELLCQWIGGSRRVVDIGCFGGGFLTFLGEGWDKFGVEPSAAAAAVASRERGIQIIAPTLQAVPQEFCGSFDAAIALDVMEHLSDPVTELRLIARLIKPGGILMIETGNTDSPDWARFGQLHHYCGLVEHVSFFGRSSIERAAANAGYRLVHFEPSQHSEWQPRWRLLYPVYNAAYVVLRKMLSLRLPLSARMRAIAAGPVPRMYERSDHFLAVLRRE